MSRPFTLVQISDPHLGASWAHGEPVDLLAATVDRIRVSGPSPDALLVTGDLADHATDDEYRQVREVLELLAVPIYALPGNHDDRGALRRHFGLPGVDDEPVNYTVDLGELRLVVLDSTRPGEDGGELKREQLGWLEARLAEARDTPTVVAIHHPPLTTGVQAWDRTLLSSAERLTFGSIVGQHPQIRRIVAGHLHRTITGAVSGRSVLVAPSTYVQFQIAFGADTISLASESPGFAVHAMLDGELVSYIQTLSTEFGR